MGDSSVIVVNNADGRRYKMVMKGDLGSLSVSRIKRYLHSATGAAPEHQRLSFNNRLLGDDVVGAEAGIYDGAVLFLDLSNSHTSPPGPATRSDFSPTERLLREKEEEARELRIRIEEAKQREVAATRNAEESVRRMEHTLRAQQAQLDDLRGVVRRLDGNHSRASPPRATAEESISIFDNLRRNLDGLADELQLDCAIELDANNTSVVPLRADSADGREATLLLTFDAAEGRLYMYSTLLSHLPRDPSVRLKLYEVLLEGGLLGREMAGGGVGVSVKSELVLLSVSFDIAHVDSRAVAASAPTFLKSLSHWSSRLEEYHDM
jgi:hypothetical protein